LEERVFAAEEEENYLSEKKGPAQAENRRQRKPTKWAPLEKDEQDKEDKDRHG